MWREIAKECFFYRAENISVFLKTYFQKKFFFLVRLEVMVIVYVSSFLNNDPTSKKDPACKYKNA